MEQTTPDFYLIADSLGVSLLDGITNWREQFRTSGEHDKSFGVSFQGWANGSMINAPFLTDVIDQNSSLKKIHAWVRAPKSTGTTQGILATINSSNVLDINHEFLQFLQSWNDPTPLVSMIASGKGYLFPVFNHPKPEYDFFDPEVPGIEKNMPIIDDIFIDRLVADWVNPVYFATIAMVKSGKNHIHVLPPPPLENPERTKHLEGLDQFVNAYGFLRGRTRVKWYRRYCRELTRRLEKLNCRVLPAPPGTCNSDGLLLQEYAEGLTHANSKYGRLVAEQIASSLRAFS